LFVFPTREKGNHSNERGQKVSCRPPKRRGRFGELVGEKEKKGGKKEEKKVASPFSSSSFQGGRDGKGGKKLRIPRGEHQQPYP